MALSSIAKTLLVKAVKTMTTEDLQGEVVGLEEELVEGEEVVEIINTELAGRPEV